MDKPARSNSFSWPIAFGVLAIFGLVDSIVLTFEHYAKQNLPCTLSGGCEKVLTSQYSTIAGLPIALLGVVFYGLVLFLAIYAIANKTALPRLFLLGWGAIGFLSSLVLTGLQAFVIRAWCQYCLFSALTSTVIFCLAIGYFLRHNNLVLKQHKEKGGEDE